MVGSDNPTPLGRGGSLMGILDEIYRIKQKDFTDKLQEATNPSIVYVTDLTSCSMKRIMRIRYPLLSFRFEPPIILGELVHTGLEKILMDKGWKAEVQVEKRVNIDGTEYLLKGRADLVKYSQDDESKAEEIVEIKTGRDLPLNAPHEHHALQLRIYLDLFGAKKGYLVYITPERIVEFSVDPEPVDIETLIRETIYNERAPRYEWECRYCPYRRICPFAKTR